MLQTSEIANTVARFSSAVALDTMEFGASLREHSPEAVAANFQQYNFPLQDLSFDFSRHVRNLLEAADAEQAVPQGKIISFPERQYRLAA